eukprot:UC4_evm10s426
MPVSSPLGYSLMLSTARLEYSPPDPSLALAGYPHVCSLSSRPQSPGIPAQARPLAHSQHPFLVETTSPPLLPATDAPFLPPLNTVYYDIATMEHGTLTVGKENVRFIVSAFEDKGKVKAYSKPSRVRVVVSGSADIYLEGDETGKKGSAELELGFISSFRVSNTIAETFTISIQEMAGSPSPFFVSPASISKTYIHDATSLITVVTDRTNLTVGDLATFRVKCVDKFGNPATRENRTIKVSPSDSSVISYPSSKTIKLDRGEGELKLSTTLPSNFIVTFSKDFVDDAVKLQVGLEGKLPGLGGGGSGDGASDDGNDSINLEYVPGPTKFIKVFAPTFDNNKTMTSHSLLEGDTFDLNLTARDQFGNMAREYRALRMSVSGAGMVGGVAGGRMFNFSNGRATVTISSNNQGPIVVSLEDPNSEFSDALPAEGVPLQYIYFLDQNFFIPAAFGEINGVNQEITLDNPLPIQSNLRVQVRVVSGSRTGMKTIRNSVAEDGLILTPDVTLVFTGEKSGATEKPVSLSNGEGIAIFTTNEAEEITISVKDTKNTGIATYFTKKVRFRSLDAKNYVFLPPSQINAGNLAAVVIQANDLAGNVATSTTGQVRVKMTGLAILSGSDVTFPDPDIKSEVLVNLREGQGTINIFSKDINTISLSLVSDNPSIAAPAPLELNFAPGAPYNLDIDFLGVSLANVNTTVPFKITMKDEFGNIITMPSKNVIEFDVPGATITVGAFEDGIAQATIFTRIAGETDVKGTLQGSTASGSAVVTFIPLAAAIVDVRVKSPIDPDTSVDDPGITFIAAARDQFGNRVPDVDGEVRLRSIVEGEIDFKPSSFTPLVLGRAEFVISCRKSKGSNIGIEFRHNKTTLDDSFTAVINLKSGRTVGFRADGPSNARADRSFEGKIIAVDQFGNIADHEERDVAVRANSTNVFSETNDLGVIDIRMGYKDVQYKSRVAEDVILSVYDPKPGPGSELVGMDLTFGFNFSFIGGDTRKIELVDPIDEIVGTPATVTAIARDEYGNKNIRETRNLFLVAKGNLKAPLLTNGGEMTMINGVATVQASSDVVQLVDLSMSDANNLYETYVVMSDKQILGFYAKPVSGTDDNSEVIELSIRPSDLNMVKSYAMPSRLGVSSLFQAKDKSFLALGTESILDMAGNAPESTFSGIALGAADYDADIIAPYIKKFDLDLDQGYTDLYFSEPINVSTARPELVTILDESSQDSVVVLSEKCNITSPSMDFITSHIRIELTSDNLNNIKRVHPLGAFKERTSMALNAGFARDKAENFADPSPSIMVNTLIPDQTQANLKSFRLNMTSGTVHMQFDEVIRSSSVRAKQISFQNRATNPTQRYTLLEEGTIDVENDLKIKLTIAEKDLNAIKKYDDLATSVENSYIVLEHKFKFGKLVTPVIQDMNGVAITQVTSDKAKKADSFAVDTIGPKVLDFDVDINENLLTIYSSERMANAVSLSDIQLSNKNNLSRRLEFSSVDSHGLTSTIIKLSDLDANFLKLNAICQVNTSCSIIIKSGAMKDMVGYEVSETQIDFPKNFVGDSLPPKLLDFRNMDLLNHKFTMKFSEAVQLDSFDFSSLYLENFFSDPPSTLQLPQTRVFKVEEMGTLVTFSVSRSDMNALKAKKHLCSFRGDCYISIRSNFVSDAIGNLIEPTATGSSFLCNSLVDDTDTPVLLSFGLDLNYVYSTSLEGFSKLTLEFQESIDKQSYEGGISLKSTKKGTLQLQDVDLSSNSSPTILDIKIGSSNTMALKRFVSGLTSKDIYLNMEEGSIADMAINPNKNEKISDFGPLGENDYQNDTISPILQNAVLDMNSDTLSLTFNEPVRGLSSFDPKKIY